PGGRRPRPPGAEGGGGPPRPRAHRGGGQRHDPPHRCGPLPAGLRGARPGAARRGARRPPRRARHGVDRPVRPATADAGRLAGPPPRRGGAAGGGGVRRRVRRHRRAHRPGLPAEPRAVLLRRRFPSQRRRLRPVGRGGAAGAAVGGAAGGINRAAGPTIGLPPKHVFDTLAPWPSPNSSPKIPAPPSGQPAGRGSRPRSPPGCGRWSWPGSGGWPCPARWEKSFRGEGSSGVRWSGSGATSLLLSLLAAGTAAGEWAAVVDGDGVLGGLAAAEAGVALERLAVVRAVPPALYGRVVATLLDGVTVEAAVVPRGFRPADARRLEARARERAAVLVAAGAWPGEAALRLRAEHVAWRGLGRGEGLLAERVLRVAVSGRGSAGRERIADLVTGTRAAA